MKITSAENPKFKALHRLIQSSQERKKTGLSVLDGAHLLAAYHRHVGAPEQLVVSSSGRKLSEVRALFERMPGVEPLELRDELFQRLSSVVTPTGVIALVRTPRPVLVPREIGTCVMIEALQDPGNLGSILRSAAAAGVADVLLSQTCAHAWSPRVLRAGMGAHFLLRIHEGVDLRATAKAFGGRVVATVPGRHRSVFEEDLTGQIALAFGNEGGGLSPGLAAQAHARVAIPMPGGTESLNVAAAAAICLFERVRQLDLERRS